MDLRTESTLGFAQPAKHDLLVEERYSNDQISVRLSVNVTMLMIIYTYLTLAGF